MTHLIDVLYERGFVEQTTHQDELREYLDQAGRSCYIGFDPTADSLHIGSLVPIMALAHVQRCGHIPIALVGGGTGLVGDPSGKTEMRKLLGPEDISRNAESIKSQLARFIVFEKDRALLLNNADWLARLEYIPFLRDVGRHFSVNRMIRAESYKMRLESDEGLSFIEFNYMLLQAYDFLMLFDRHGCGLQMGGSDQWGNIVAGIDLIRRMRQKSAFGITFPLITTSSGAKMGKTEKGAVWLDAGKTSPYDYFQYWVNTDDRDVQRFLALFTFLPMAEIQGVEALSGADLNAAKRVLAFEATQLAHGLEAAKKAYHAAASMFGKGKIPAGLLSSSAIHKGEAEFGDAAVPRSTIDIKELESGIPAFQLFCRVGLAASGSAARRLVDQGGAYLNGERIPNFDTLISAKDLKEGAILLRAGKKRYHKLSVS